MLQVLPKRFKCRTQKCLIVYARELVTVPLLGPFVVSDQVEHASEGFGEGDLQGFKEERGSYLLHLWYVNHLVELVLNAL